MDNGAVISGVTYALVVAVEKYNNPSSFKKVAHAEKDAQDFVAALHGINVHPDDIVVLLNEIATKSAILAELKTLSKRTLENDRIIVFFAGHGVYIDQANHIAPVDAYKNNLQDTCVPIREILGYLKNAACNRNLLFLDCCHSGFEPGDLVRDSDATFLADELKYQYKDEEYCIGFASCKSNQVSVSHPKLKNGVWSHHLIKALKGEAGKIYDRGILFSDKLQSYLNKEVAEFVKMNTTDRKDQTPIIFGNLTDKFIIADLNPIFEEKERNRKVAEVSFYNVALLSEEDGQIKQLPGFQKGFHHVPTNNYSGANQFVQDCGTLLIKEEIDHLSTEIGAKMNYKRKDLEAWSEDSGGAIDTPDFTYTMQIYQSEEDPSEYVLERKLTRFEGSKAILEDELNSIFSSYFERLEFDLPKKVDVEALIDIIEEVEDEGKISVDYNRLDTSSCTISIKGLSCNIQVSSDTMAIVYNYKTDPATLIEAFKETHKVVLENPQLKLLPE